MSTIDPKAVWPGWETVRLIGRGSFGAVYEIQRDVFGETEKAALKLISIPQSESDISEMRSDGYDDESITSTFQAHLRSIVAEYSLMRKLNGSANVVNCDDVRYVQHKNGFGWDILIKMELLTPLTQALPAEIPEEQAVKIGKDLARALVQCRQFDIVHRDIKPQNIFVSPLGDYKLGDFGIAKTVEKTSGGTKIGTYKYMAPEVYNNQPYGAGADIYSLGLVLYWLLNERRMPFLPLPPAKLGAGMEEQARLRRFRGERIPAPLHGSEALKQIVLKCCAFDPKDRFANAEELLRALEKAEKNSEFGVRNSEDEREAPPAPVGAGLAPARKQEPDSPGGASPSPTPEDETVGVFGSAAVGAAINRPPVKEPAPDEEATVSAAMPVGADAPGGPKSATDRNGLSRAPAPTPETTVPAEDATVGSARRPSAPAAKGSKKGLVITLAALLVIGIAIGALFLTGVLGGNKDYDRAMEFYKNGQYEEAAALFDSLGDYKDSAEMANSSRYEQGKNAYNQGDYSLALRLFQDLGSYKDSAEWTEKCHKILSLVGTWMLSGMTQDGQYVDYLYQNFKLILNDDGTGYMKVYGQKADVTWDESGITNDGETIPYTLDGDKLILAEDNTEIVFIRDVPPNGSYKLTGIKIDGEDYSSLINEIGYDDYTITFNSDGTGKLVGSGDNIPFTWDENNIDDGTDVIPYTYTSNSVSFETEGVEMTFTK